MVPSYAAAAQDGERVMSRNCSLVYSTTDTGSFGYVPPSSKPMRQ